jgi:predicted Zn-dependent protease
MRRPITALFALLTSLLPLSALAHDDGLHWHRGGEHVPITYTVSPADARALQPYLQRGLQDWSQHTVVDFRRARGEADLTVVAIHAPGTGILGRTTLSFSEGHIVKAKVEINTLSELPPAAAQRVVTHELGHVLGLIHHQCQPCGGVMLDGGPDAVTSAHDRADVDGISSSSKRTGSCGRKESDGEPRNLQQG